MDKKTQEAYISLAEHHYALIYNKYRELPYFSVVKKYMELISNDYSVNGADFPNKSGAVLY